METVEQGARSAKNELTHLCEHDTDLADGDGARFIVVKDVKRSL